MTEELYPVFDVPEVSDGPGKGGFCQGQYKPCHGVQRTGGVYGLVL